MVSSSWRRRGAFAQAGKGVGVPPVVVSVDDARHGARSFVLAALRALHIAPLRVAVLIGYYPGAGLGEGQPVAFGLLGDITGRSPVMIAAW